MFNPFFSPSRHSVSFSQIPLLLEFAGIVLNKRSLTAVSLNHLGLHWISIENEQFQCCELGSLPLSESLFYLFQCPFLCNYSNIYCICLQCFIKISETEKNRALLPTLWDRDGNHQVNSRVHIFGLNRCSLSQNKEKEKQKNVYEMLEFCHWRLNLEGNVWWII